MQESIKMKTQPTKSAVIQIFTTINNFIYFLAVLFGRWI